MSDVLPRPFNNVVARDCWAWRYIHIDISILPGDAQERLLDMPNAETLEPFGQEWAAYAKKIALSLEQKRKWLEAQAYWLANAQLLAQTGEQGSAALIESFTGIARTGCGSAGTIPVMENFEEIINEGLCSLESSVQKAASLSLLMIGTIQNSIYDDLALSSQARIGFVQSLSFLPASQNKKAFSHIVFETAVRQYSQCISQLHAQTDIVTSNSTFENIKSQRGKLIEQISRLTNFFLETEGATIAKIRHILTQNFRQYLKAYEDAGDALEAAYQPLQQNLQSVIKDLQTSGSYLSSCILLPLILSAERAITTHFSAIIHSRLPDLKLRLIKPEARRHGNTLAIDIEITNEGAGLARNCGIEFRSPQTRHIIFNQNTIMFGDLESGTARIESCSFHCASSELVISLQYVLQWTDKSGSQERLGVLKVGQQRELNWDELFLSSPYNIRSITDPGQLKGRKDLLRELRLGISGQVSFMITGQKRVGKTSLIKVFLSELHERLDDMLAIYMPIGEFSASAGDDLGHFGQEIIKRIAEEYENISSETMNITIPSIEEFRDSFNESFTRCIRQITRRHSLKLVIALDDFDELPTALFTGSLGKMIFLALRAVINDGTAFFFIGSERLPAIIKEQAERLNQVRTLKVDYLDRNALIELVREPVDKLLEFDDAALTTIEVWSARNPYFATLICRAIWEQALDKHDYYVTEYDAKNALKEFVKKSSRNNYEHFWSDSALADERSRYNYEKISRQILLALSQLQPDPVTYANRYDVINQCETSNKNEAKIHLQDLISSSVVETDKENADLVRIRVPLFTFWLQEGGANELRQDEITRQSQEAAINWQEELSAAEVTAASQALSYQGESIGTDQVRVWAAQFGNLDDQRLMLKLLQRLGAEGLYTEARTTYALKQIHEMILQEARNLNIPLHVASGAKRYLLNLCVTHIDSIGESGGALVSRYRQINRRVLERLCGTPHKVFTAISQALQTSPLEKFIVVCIDDFIGSGQSATNQLGNLIPQMRRVIPNWQEHILLIYATIVGFEKGIEFIEEKIPENIKVLSQLVFDSLHLADSKEKGVF